MSAQARPSSKRAKKGSQRPRTVDLDLVIVGGGLLGTAVAALASGQGFRPLVLRLCDDSIPRADTLRNQGWLQSGLLYRRKEFTNSAAYRRISKMTRAWGRRMLEDLQLEARTDHGVLRVEDAKRRAEIEEKAQWLRIPASEFFQLEPDEARKRLGAFYERESTYFAIPDAPFDEAGSLEKLRAIAIENGAEFVQLDAPVTLTPHHGNIQIQCDDWTIDSPLTLVSAGASVVPLTEQLGVALPIVLRRTPLFVHSGACDMTAPIMVDWSRGYSAVRHSNSGSDAAIVVGTRVHLEPAEFALPDNRRVTAIEVAEFSKCLHPHLGLRVGGGRFTAGYEVIPIDAEKRLASSSVEHWVKDLGNVVVAYPGRATLTLKAAYDTFYVLEKKMSPKSRSFFALLPKRHRKWKEAIHMHFWTPPYSFNDAEN